MRVSLRVPHWLAGFLCHSLNFECTVPVHLAWKRNTVLVVPHVGPCLLHSRGKKDLNSERPITSSSHRHEYFQKKIFTLTETFCMTAPTTQVRVWPTPRPVCVDPTNHGSVGNRRTEDVYENSRHPRTQNIALLCEATGLY